MITKYVKNQGKEYNKLHDDRQLALFINTSQLAAGIFYWGVSIRISLPFTQSLTVSIFVYTVMDGV